MPRSEDKEPGGCIGGPAFTDYLPQV